MDVEDDEEDEDVPCTAPITLATLAIAADTVAADIPPCGVWLVGITAAVRFWTEMGRMLAKGVVSLLPPRHGVTVAD